MLNEEPLGNKQLTRSDSCFLDIDESFVRSDIAEIIGKMYTPRSANNGDVRGGAESRMWEVDEAPRKRFGFYFESVTSRNDIESSRDTSTSDVVSLPSIRNLPRRRLGSVCKCCKRQILNRISEKRIKNACSNCQRKYVDHGLTDKECFYSKQTKNNENDQCEVKQCVKQEYFGKCQHKSSCCQHTKHFSENKIVLDTKEQSSIPKESTISESERPYGKNECQRMEFKSNKSPVICNYSTNLTREEYSTTRERLCCMPDQIQEVQSLQVVPDLGKGNISDLPMPKKMNYDSNSKKRNKTVERTVFRRIFEGVSIYGMFNRKIKTSTKVLNEIHVPLRKELFSFKEEQNKPPLIIDIDPPSQDPKSGISQGVVDENRVETIFQSKQIDYTKSGCNIFIENATSRSNDIPIRADCETLPVSQTNGTNSILDKDHKGCVIPVENPSTTSSTIQADCNRWHGTQINNTAILEKKILSEHENRKRNSEWTSEFWGNVFNYCHVAMSFLTSFVLQLLKFLMESVARPLTWGFLQTVSEHFFQPCLSTLYMSLLKPIFLLGQNVAESFRDLCHPFAQCLGYFVQEFSYIIRAFRLIEINHIHKEPENNQKI